MKRLHVSVAVSDIEKSISFYSALFAAQPTVRKPDYAKWMLEDPRVNFSISSHGREKGVDHLGIQVDDDAELAVIAGRLAEAGQSIHEQKATTCCYARSNKAWVHDPEGVAWETFHTFGESTVYGESREAALASDAAESSACCTPKPATAEKSACCGPTAKQAHEIRTMADLAQACHDSAA
jgi:catechol 2,3-dioxygenase-like lactoylglutathione lyase family enzyme